MFAKSLFREAEAQFNTIKHLKKHHVKVHKEFSARGQKDERSRLESLLESFQKQGKLSANNMKAEKLLNFIVLDDQPLSVVENVGLHSLIEHLQPRYSLPSRRYLLETALPELYNRLSNKLAENLKGAPALSFTTDIWTSDVCPMSLISLTVQWADSDTHGLCSAVLQVKKFCNGSLHYRDVKSLGDPSGKSRIGVGRYPNSGIRVGSEVKKCGSVHP